MIASLLICIARRADGVELGCWPWWATGLPIVAVLLLLYIAVRENER